MNDSFFRFFDIIGNLMVEIGEVGMEIALWLENAVATKCTLEDFFVLVMSIFVIAALLLISLSGKFFPTTPLHTRDRHPDDDLKKD